MNLQEFSDGMRKLGLAFNRQITEPVLEVYGQVLSRRLTTEQWGKAVTHALEAERFFPAPAVLLRYGADERGIGAAAGEAYAAIVASYESGLGMAYREIADKIGKAAAEGFIAAGGSRRFSWCEPADEPFRLRDFKSGFVEEAEVDPLALTPAAEHKQLR